MKIVDKNAVEEWTYDDVATAAKPIVLTDKQKNTVLEQMCKEYSKETGWSKAKMALLVKSIFGSEEQTEQTTSTVDAKVFKWYYHSKSKNETKEAIATAIASNRPMLICACKPSCDVCNLTWNTYLKATGKMAEWLKTNKVIGLKIDDVSSHYTDLSKFKNKWTGIDGVSGKKVNSTAPFFAFVKVKSSAKGKTKITLDPDKNEIDVFIGGFGSAKSTEKTYEAITSWLDGLMKLSAFKTLFK